jgi:hypothetical protein
MRIPPELLMMDVVQLAFEASVANYSCNVNMPRFQNNRQSRAKQRWEVNLPLQRLTLHLILSNVRLRLQDLGFNVTGVLDDIVLVRVKKWSIATESSPEIIAQTLGHLNQNIDLNR